MLEGASETNKMRGVCPQHVGGTARWQEWPEWGEGESGGGGVPRCGPLGGLRLWYPGSGAQEPRPGEGVTKIFRIQSKQRVQGGALRQEPAQPL